jgi:uncharacterized membrane protein
VGTAAGVLAALIVAVAYGLIGHVGIKGMALSAAAGIIGTIADSIMGATLERRGWIGNNGVNFASTAIAAAFAFAVGPS